jgi:predicted nucleotidyltransferase
MVEVTRQVLDRMVEAIVHEVDPEEVWLFGSRARGERGSESDVDLLVVEREPFGPDRPMLDEYQRISLALRGIRVPTDILLYSRDQFNRWRNSLNHVIGRCVREGRVLYERS